MACDGRANARVHKSERKAGLVVLGAAVGSNAAPQECLSSVTRVRLATLSKLCGKHNRMQNSLPLPGPHGFCFPALPPRDEMPGFWPVLDRYAALVAPSCRNKLPKNKQTNRQRSKQTHRQDEKAGGHGQERSTQNKPGNKRMKQNTGSQARPRKQAKKGANEKESGKPDEAQETSQQNKSNTKAAARCSIGTRPRKTLIKKKAVNQATPKGKQ